MAKAHPLGVRLEPADHAALKRLAKASKRSMAAVMRDVLAGWLRTHARRNAKLKKAKAITKNG